MTMLPCRLKFSLQMVIPSYGWLYFTTDSDDSPQIILHYRWWYSSSSNECVWHKANVDEQVSALYMVPWSWTSYSEASPLLGLTSVKWYPYIEKNWSCIANILDIYMKATWLCLSFSSPSIELINHLASTISAEGSLYWLCYGLSPGFIKPLK